MRIAAVACVVALAGCPICELDDQLDIVDGASSSSTVPTGGSVALSLDSEGFQAGPGHCRGHWYVDGVEGGSLDTGTIDGCGVYVAPAFPLDRVLVEATRFPTGSCADCCPYGQRELTIVAR